MALWSAGSNRQRHRSREVEAVGGDRDVDISRVPGLRPSLDRLGTPCACRRALRMGSRHEQQKREDRGGTIADGEHHLENNS